MTGVGIGRFVNIAHRGASGHAPENTLPAFGYAMAMGADFLELDVQRSADGVLVAFHDATLERTTDATGRLAERTLAELKALDAGSWFGGAHADFAGVRIATLAEVLDYTTAATALYVEAKDARHYPGIERDLVDTLAAHGRLGARRTVLQAFDPASLRRYRAFAPGVPRVQLLAFEWAENQWLVERDGVVAPVRTTAEIDWRAVASLADGIGPNAEAVDADLVRGAHAGGLFVHVYTVDEPPCMERLIAAGVDGLFTDFPDRLAARLRAGAGAGQ